MALARLEERENSQVLRRARRGWRLLSAGVAAEEVCAKTLSHSAERSKHPITAVSVHQLLRLLSFFMLLLYP